MRSFQVLKAASFSLTRRTHTVDNLRCKARRVVDFSAASPKPAKQVDNMIFGSLEGYISKNEPPPHCCQ